MPKFLSFTFAILELSLKVLGGLQPNLTEGIFRGLDVLSGITALWSTFGENP